MRAPSGELRQGIEQHRSRPEIEDQRVAPGHQRERTVRVLGELRQSGGSAGVKQRRHGVAVDRLRRHQPVGRLSGAGLFVVDDAGNGRSAADAEHPELRHRRSDGLHLRPDIREDRRTRRDQCPRARLLHDGADLRGFEEVVDGIGDGRDLGAPQCEEGLRHARHQQRHGVVRPDAVRIQQVCRLKHVSHQLLEGDVAHGIGGATTREVANGHPAGMLTRRLAQQVRHAGVADALRHRHLLESFYVCLGADLHRRFPILYP